MTCLCVAAIALWVHISPTPSASAQAKWDVEKNRTIRIAVVNITTVFEKYTKKVEKQDEIQEDWKVKLEHIEALEKEIIALREAIKLFEKGTEERKRKEKELEKKRLERKLYQTQATANLARRSLDSQKQLYEDVFANIKKYAEKEGYDLILYFARA